MPWPSTININFGAGAGAGDGDSVYSAFMQIQTRFNDLVTSGPSITRDDVKAWLDTLPTTPAAAALTTHGYYWLTDDDGNALFARVSSHA